MNDLSRLNADSTSVPSDKEGTALPQELQSAPPEKPSVASDAWELAVASSPATSPSGSEPDLPVESKTASENTPEVTPETELGADLQVDSQISEPVEAEKEDAGNIETPESEIQAHSVHSEPAQTTQISEVDDVYSCARVVGARLTQLREEKNWLLDDVSAQLKVPVSKLRALEAGEVSVLPDAAFTLGLVRAYSKMLGIDPAPFIEELRNANGPLKEALTNLGMHRELLAKHVLNAPSLVRSKWAGFKRHQGRFAALIGLGVACLAIVGLLVFGHKEASLRSVSAEELAAATNANSQGLPTPAELTAQSAALPNQGVIPATQTVVPAKPVLASSAPVAVHQVSSSLSPATLTPAQAPAPATMAPTAQPAANNALAPATTLAPGVTPVAPVQAQVVGPTAVIHFRVSQDNWISVSQTDGKVLYAGLLKAGSERNVQGVAPFKVTAGSKTGLDAVTLNGKPVDLSKYLATKQDVVRFNLQ